MHRALIFIAYLFLMHQFADGLERLDAPLPSSDAMITFDDRGWYVMPTDSTGSVTSWEEKYHGPLVLNYGNQQVTITGSGCMAQMVYGSDQYGLDSPTFWDGSTTEKPGYYLMVFDSCNIEFGNPVNVFTMRVRGIGTERFLVTQSNGEQTDLTIPPTSNFDSVNGYDTVGIAAEEGAARIKSFSVTADPYIFAVDNVEWVVCLEGRNFVNNTCQICTETCGDNALCNETAAVCQCINGFEGDGFTCEDLDECFLFSPCSSDAYCNNTKGAFNCTCMEGYEGDGFICSDIDECSLVQSPCSSLAYCNNTKGSFDCTCTDGYEGGGVGSDGCTQVIEPVTPPVTDNVPEKAPTGAAGVSSGASLFERSKEVLFVFLLCVCVAALKLF